MDAGPKRAEDDPHETLSVSALLSTIALGNRESARDAQFSGIERFRIERRLGTGSTRELH
jgi:hypothetical protein